MEMECIFAIVSLTTIGFGDITPAPEHLRELQYVILYLTWLLIGLVIISVLVTKMSKDLLKSKQVYYIIV